MLKDRRSIFRQHVQSLEPVALANQGGTTTEPSTYDVGIVGLCYVGLTLATVLADSGNRVIGVEKREELVELTNNGVPHFTETGLQDALSRVMKSGILIAAHEFDKNAGCDTYIITVGTPLSRTARSAWT